MFKRACFLLNFIILFCMSQQAHARITVADSTNISFYFKSAFSVRIAVFLSDAKGYKQVYNNKVKQQDGLISIKIANHYLPAELAVATEYYKTEQSEAILATSPVILHPEKSLKIEIAPQSLVFDQTDTENLIYQSFLAQEQAKQKDLSVLEGFLFNYQDKAGNLFHYNQEAYQQQLNTHNKWISSLNKQHQKLFVSGLFPLYIKVPYAFNSADFQQLYLHKLNYAAAALDPHDARLLNAVSLPNRLQNILNVKLLNKQSGETGAAKLYMDATEILIKHFANGNGKLYGWIVDYLYANADLLKENKEVKAYLEAAAQSSNCLVDNPILLKFKKTGNRSLKAGEQAPDFKVKQSLYSVQPDQYYQLYNENNKTYTLLIFWSAECPHCNDLINEVQQVMQSKLYESNLNVVTIGLDQDGHALEEWKRIASSHANWTNILLEKGIENQIARDYVVHQIPTLFLVNNKTKTVEQCPEKMEDLYNKLIKTK